uniref:Topoisom_bac domain-containing protein n=1 Tax=Ascaris lumbricoides TaxID=6252 RepID=A0A0M3INV3_ASCLU
MPFWFRLFKSKVGDMLSASGYAKLNTQRAFSKAGMALVATSTAVSSKADTGQFWKLETLKTDDPMKPKEDVTATEQFKTTITKSGNGQYVVDGRGNPPRLKFLITLAYALGLKFTLKRLKGDEELFKRYDDTLKQQLQPAIIEKAPKVPGGLPISCIPHQKVLAPQKSTTKLRLALMRVPKKREITP